MFGNSIAGDLFAPLNCGFRVREGSNRRNKSELADVRHRACRTLVRFAAFVLSGSLVSGCLATLQGDPDRLYPVQYEMEVARQILRDSESQYYGVASQQQRQGIRNDIIARRMYIIDAQYSVYEANLTREHQEVDFAADAASLGLNTAGTLVTPAATTRLLGGIAGAVIGVKGNYESDIVIAKTVQIVQLQMRANRDNVSARILQRMRENTITYPLSLALSDLEDYYRAGTFTSGLMQATSTVGDKAEIAKVDKENALVISIPAHDNQRTELRALLYPNGPRNGSNPTVKAEVARILGNESVNLPTYINDPQYSRLRSQLADCIRRMNTNRCPSNSLP